MINYYLRSFMRIRKSPVWFNNWTTLYRRLNAKASSFILILLLLPAAASADEKVNRVKPSGEITHLLIPVESYFRHILKKTSKPVQLRGRITDQQGEGVADVHIVLSCPSLDERRILTDRNGEYEVLWLSQNTNGERCSVAARKAGYRTRLALPPVRPGWTSMKNIVLIKNKESTYSADRLLAGE